MNTPARSRYELDVTSVVGAGLGIGLVVAAELIGGGPGRSLLQVTALLIVFGGTASAVLVSFSLGEVLLAARGLLQVFSRERGLEQRAIARLVRYATRARRDGLIALDRELPAESDPFLHKALTLVVDGTDRQVVRDLLDIEDATRAERDESPVRVFEAAGGFAPTFGILGAVLGLIHVMENLTDPTKLGAGIAVAFVATVYGVGSANLLFLPIAAKLRVRARRAAKLRELVLEGVLSIHDGLNPRVIEEKLRGFTAEPPSPRPVLRQPQAA